MINIDEHDDLDFSVKKLEEGRKGTKDMWWRLWGELGRRQDTIEFTYKDLQDASAILQVRSRIQVTQFTQGLMEDQKDSIEKGS